MSDAYATFKVEGRQVHVRSSLRNLEQCLHPQILGALADHLGFSVQPLEKAVALIDVDPRYPWLRTMIERARSDWNRHGTILVEEISRLLRSGRLLPLTSDNEGVLRQLLENHEVGIALDFVGRHHNTVVVDRLVQSGAVSADYADRATVPISYRLGRGLNALAAHRVPGAAPSLEEVLRQAVTTPLTDQDRAAMDFARRRAGIYMRRPAQARQTEAERVLTTAEQWAIGETVAQGVEGRRSWRSISQDLAGAMGGSTLTNDADRVARTEVHQAQSLGAYVGLKEATTSIGVEDPLVYKLVRPNACDDCRRIWGDPKDPIRYLLSFIEGREAAGGNFRIPHDQWGPVIGPVHPNCTEGALLYWREDLFEATQAALQDLDDWFGT